MVETQDSPSRDQDKIIIRVPEGMRDALKAAAASNNRSMNAEIVERLQQSMEWPRIAKATEESLALLTEKIRVSGSLADEVAELAEYYKTEAETANIKVEALRARLQRLRGEQA